MNRVFLSGRLTKEPEIQNKERLDKTLMIAKYTLAVPRAFNDKVDFINCVVFERKAEIAQKYLTKGKMVTVSGSLVINVWSDKEGNKHKDAEIIVDEQSFEIKNGTDKEIKEYIEDLPF